MTTRAELRRQLADLKSKGIVPKDAQLDYDTPQRCWSITVPVKSSSGYFTTRTIGGHVFPISSKFSQWMRASLDAGKLVDPMELPSKPPKVADKQQGARQAKEIERLTTENILLRRENEKLLKELGDERHAREASERELASLKLKYEANTHPSR